MIKNTCYFNNFDDLDRSLWGYVSEGAVATVIKCLGLRDAQYQEYRHIYQSIHQIWFIDEYKKIQKNCIRPDLKAMLKYKKPVKFKPEILSAVSDEAVGTVLKYLGLSNQEYQNCRLMHREFRWVGMPWYIYQYNDMIKDMAIPYLKEKK